MVVERGKDVLGISAIDPIPILVEHEDIDEMGPGIDFIVWTQTAAATQPLVPGGNFGLDPDLVGIRCPLAEWMTQRERAEDYFKQVPVPRLERGDFGTQRRC